MAPARMVSFMERHVEDCPICQNDSDIYKEIAKITEIVLPESKIPKAVRMQNEAADDEYDEDDSTDDDSDEDEDVYDDDDDDFEEEPELSDD